MNARKQFELVVRKGLVAALVAGLLLSTGGRALAQDSEGYDDMEPAVAAPAEMTEASADMEAMDPNEMAVEDELVESSEDTTLQGPDAAEDGGHLEAVDTPELADASRKAGPEIGEHGELAMPLPEGTNLMFLPSVTTDGFAATQMSSELDAAGAAATAGATASQSIMGDFNGDGRADLAIGVPYEDLVAGGVNRVQAGAVNVIYGSAAGLTAAGDQVWTQDVAGILDIVDPDDLFGYALAVGDFNGDNRDDLAIGAPHEDFGGLTNAGVVHILYGSAAGLTAAGNQLWSQNTAGVFDLAENSDAFGRTLSAGDYDNDGRDDLAVGVPAEDIGGLVDAGIVQVLYGTAAGLNAFGNQVWHQSVGGIPDIAEAGDQFGRALASGDVDNNGSDDLAVGVPNEDLVIAGVNRADAGVVHLIRGSAANLTAAGTQLTSQNAAGILGVSEAFDNFGHALAIGDYNGNGFMDLAVGVPFEDNGALVNSGAVNVIYGAAVGLIAAGNQVWQQNTAGIADVDEQGDAFGYALAAGRFNAGLPFELVVGVPGEDLAGLNSVGAVHVIYGTAAGLNAAGDQFWTQNSAGVPEVMEAFDEFGLSLAVGDFNGNARHDLVIGVPYEDIGGVTNMGAVNVIYGPLGGAAQQFWSQDSAGILGVGELNDFFAYVNQ
jgi:hypothetical protein